MNTLREIPSRIYNAAYDATVVNPNAVVIAVKDSGKTIYGIAASALAILTVGKVARINQAAEQTYHSEDILPGLYKATFKFFKTDFQYDEKYSRLGIVTTTFAKPIFELTNAAKNSETSKFKRQVASRIGIALGTVVATITCVADLVLGIVAAGLSFTVKRGIVNPRINTVAMSQLSSLGVIHHFCSGLRHVFNPYPVK